MSEAQIPQPVTNLKTVHENQPTPSTDTAKEPIREFLDSLQRVQTDISRYNKPLADRIDDLLKQAGDPLRLNQRSFHHEVAYTFQDIEKKTSAITISTEARSHLSHLTGSAPGLENERMLALMRATTGINDDAVVRDIRRIGAEISRQANQDTPQIREQIDVLENRARLGQRAPAATTSASSGSNPQTAAPSSGESNTERPGTADPDRPNRQRQPNPEQTRPTAHQDWSNTRPHSQQQSATVTHESALGRVVNSRPEIPRFGSID